ncbi:MAG: hypothetical protein AAB657_00750 [Patescibacteria group bacterium]
MKFKVIFLFLATLILFNSTPVLAGDLASVYVGVGETVTGNLYRVGSTVEINGTVEGDVVVIGGQVVVNGQVNGDVLAIGGTVKINGEVLGNVRVFGEQVDLFGTIGKNVSIAAGSLMLSDENEIKGHINFIASSFYLNGKVVGSVNGRAERAIINGSVFGQTDLAIEKRGSLKINDKAVLQNQFIYEAVSPAQISEQASVSANLIHKPLIDKSNALGWWWNKLIGLFSALVVGLVLVKLLPHKLSEVSQEVLTKFWPSLGWGAAWAVAVPIVIIILLITIIGWPLALILTAIYFIGLLLSTALAGATLGIYLKDNKNFTKIKKWSQLATVSFGIVIYSLLVTIPFLGWLFGLLGTLAAWGALVRVQKRTIQSF